MQRVQLLKRRIDSLGTLAGLVSAMRSLSAHHLRAARGGLAAARGYREGVDALMASAGIRQTPPRVDRPAILVVAAGLGLCDGYNTRLTAAARDERRRLDAGTVYCVGRRPLAAFRRAGVPLTRTYDTVTSVGGITGLLLTVADDVLSDYLDGVFTSLHVVSARFDGIGAFTPVTTQVLPVVPTHRPKRAAATPYVSRTHLTRIAVREYLYSTLYELMLDALASEHGMRLIATQSAGEWLDERVASLSRELSNIRRELGTQEVLEVAAGARQRRARR